MRTEPPRYTDLDPRSCNPEDILATVRGLWETQCQRYRSRRSKTMNVSLPRLTVVPTYPKIADVTFLLSE